jgi:argininosuccinate lyase
VSKLWGGRFAAQTDSLMEEFGASLASDSRLAPFDLKVCRAHVTMLGETGALQPEVAARLRGHVSDMLSELEQGSLKIEGSYEDVHSWVEDVLARRAGPESSYIRLGRSRNDLVITDFRLWTMAAISEQQAALRLLQKTLATRAEEHLHTILPGYTHLQRAQPVSLAHHLLAHFWALQRDFQRLDHCRTMADCCPLGAGALAGSSWPVRPQRTAELLGFSRSFENSLDAVSDRDFAVEFLSAAALSMIHFSRMAEELILWSTPEFGFATFDDAWSTGSSLMPQKKNPDPAELIRGKSGRFVGYLTGLLTTLKSLPLAYNRDLQEDKPPVFEAADTWEMSTRVLAGVYSTLKFNPQRMQEACADPGLLATDLADALVRSGMPFAQAHELSGKWVAHRLDEGERVQVEALVADLTPQSVLAGRRHSGAAGPESVKEQLAQAQAMLK